jgi:hypothetical protein
MKGFLEFGLSKLSITAYKDREHLVPLGNMKVMYNPESLDLRYDIDYDADNYLNGNLRSNHYRQARPGQLELDLLFDASLPGQTASVESQLASLQGLCCQITPGTMETPYLRVEWGSMHWHGKEYFAGRAASLQVRYNRFDRKATPLRATAHLSLVADDSLVLQQSELGQLALQRASISVPHMSFLPMLAGLAASVAGAFGAYDYLTLALTNDLDSLDAIAPGDILVAPESLAGEE